MLDREYFRRERRDVWRGTGHGQTKRLKFFEMELPQERQVGLQHGIQAPLSSVNQLGRFPLRLPPQHPNVCCQ